MNKLFNVHPGEVLREDWHITAAQLAIAAGVDEEAAQAILDSRAPITEAIAWELSTHLGCSAAFWMNLQALYDAQEARKTREDS